MNLLDLVQEQQEKTTAPLAERMKPKSLEEFVGHEIKRV
jgi:replication-associated recombination protein RarA